MHSISDLIEVDRPVLSSHGKILLLRLTLALTLVSHPGLLRRLFLLSTTTTLGSKPIPKPRTRHFAPGYWRLVIPSKVKARLKGCTSERGGWQRRCQSWSLGWRVELGLRLCAGKGCSQG